MSAPTRILFFAETVTLAHLARPIALAKGLDATSHDITIACDPRYQRFLAEAPWRTVPLSSISSQQFLNALAQGKPVYDEETLRRYVEDDLRIIREIQPDVIVGDFRLSLSVSARLAAIPYLTISNAYWSPFYIGDGFPLPVLPLSQRLPLPLARGIFRIAQPIAFRLHCRPMNAIRRAYGLPSLGSDLRRIYTDADRTLYADIPELFPTEHLPAHHEYMGPILWSPPVAKPAWWERLPDDRPIVYLTLGSSGQGTLLPLILQALAELPVTVIVATAGAGMIGTIPDNVFMADYLPGTEAAARAQLVVCNGGSLTCQQALAAGVPILGIASNMDQFLNMNALDKAGAGRLLRADRLDVTAVRNTARALLAELNYTTNARRLADTQTHYAATTRFAAAVRTAAHS